MQSHGVAAVLSRPQKALQPAAVLQSITGAFIELALLLSIASSPWVVLTGIAAKLLRLQESHGPGCGSEFADGRSGWLLYACMHSSSLCTKVHAGVCHAYALGLHVA